MRHFFLAILFILATTNSCLADAMTALPPSDCSDSERRVITWQDGTASTLCASGQDVMNMAIPTCEDGQIVGREDGKFVCKWGVTAPIAVAPGSEYSAPSDGMLFVRINADPAHRAPIAEVFLDGAYLTHVMAQDSYVDGVPSINVNNFTYPVRKGQFVKVVITNPVAGILVQFIPQQ